MTTYVPRKPPRARSCKRPRLAYADHLVVKNKLRGARAFRRSMEARGQKMDGAV